MPTPGGYPYLQDGPSSFTVNVTTPAGVLVEPDSATGKVKPATAGSLKVLGVAIVAGVPDGTGTDLQQYAQPSRIPVQRNCVAWVTFAADCPFGSKLIAAANGQVTPAGATPDSASLVGQCFEPGGVLAGGVARAWIR